MKRTVLRSMLWVGIFGLAVFLNSSTLHAQLSLDGFDPNANGSVLAVVVQPDGKACRSPAAFLHTPEEA